MISSAPSPCRYSRSCSVRREEAKGESVASLGNTGNANASHLHFHIMDGPTADAPKLPTTQRTVETSALLDKLAASVETVALLDAYGSLRDDYMDSEQHSEMFRQIGFHSWPETAEDFVKACIADRAMGA